MAGQAVATSQAPPTHHSTPSLSRSHHTLLLPPLLTTLPLLAAKMSLLRTAAIRATRVPQLARAASTTAPHVVSSRSNQDGALLSNIEAHWSKLPAAEQYEVFQALEEAQKKDWKQLTTDEKKAGEYSERRKEELFGASARVRHFATSCHRSRKHGSMETEAHVTPPLRTRPTASMQARTETDQEPGIGGHHNYAHGPLANRQPDISSGPIGCSSSRGPNRSWSQHHRLERRPGMHSAAPTVALRSLSPLTRGVCIAASVHEDT